MLEEIVKRIVENGGRAFYVGGYVRDMLMGRNSNDIDVEVYGLLPQKLIDILSEFGEVDVVGKSFGIIILKGLDVDFAMPRKERKVGTGHRGFKVSVDPFMPYEEAARRRDFTINAIMQDCLTGETKDFFEGQKDIDKGIIRHIHDETFVEDPLRVYRAVQFAGRFGFIIAPETLDLCKQIDLSTLPKERVYEEWMKLLLKSERPSIGFEYMRQMEVISKHFPELDALTNCPSQNFTIPREVFGIILCWFWMKQQNYEGNQNLLILLCLLSFFTISENQLRRGIVKMEVSPPMAMTL